MAEAAWAGRVLETGSSCALATSTPVVPTASVKSERDVEEKDAAALQDSAERACDALRQVRARRVEVAAAGVTEQARFRGRGGGKVVEPTVSPTYDRSTVVAVPADFVSRALNLAAPPERSHAVTDVGEHSTSFPAKLRRRANARRRDAKRRFFGAALVINSGRPSILHGEQAISVQILPLSRAYYFLVHVAAHALRRPIPPGHFRQRSASLHWHSEPYKQRETSNMPAGTRGVVSRFSLRWGVRETSISLLWRRIRLLSAWTTANSGWPALGSRPGAQAKIIRDARVV
ncbi:hypothetical protein DFH11DRAFT_1881449 [Phellopilus nigrolimitatus]|nr:hypothetical protein DFH11DRAFT_1881449 [Phellopilus nigrolimitatus]